MNKINEIKFKNVQWDCIHFVSNISEVSTEKISHKLIFLVASSLSSEEGLFKALSESFNFPGYFGNNWDALDECLRDLEWLPSEDGWVLIMKGSKQLWENHTVMAGKFISSWLLSAEEWSKEQKPFHLVFVINDTEV